MTNHSLRVKIVNRNKGVTSLRDYAVAWNFRLTTASMVGPPQGATPCCASCLPATNPLRNPSVDNPVNNSCNGWDRLGKGRGKVRLSDDHPKDPCATSRMSGPVYANSGIFRKY
jgi:hypothetical protein